MVDSSAQAPQNQAASSAKLLLQARTNILPCCCDKHAPSCTAKKQQAGQNCRSLRQEQRPEREARAWSTEAMAGALWAPLREGVRSADKGCKVIRTPQTRANTPPRYYRTGRGSNVRCRVHQNLGQRNAGKASSILVQMHNPDQSQKRQKRTADSVTSGGDAHWSEAGNFTSVSEAISLLFRMRALQEQEVSP